MLCDDRRRSCCAARNTGKVRWIQQLARFRTRPKKKKDPIRWTGPILAGGRLIAVNSEGTLAEFSPTDGTLLASTEFKSSLSQPPVVANNVLIYCRRRPDHGLALICRRR